MHRRKVLVLTPDIPKMLLTIIDEALAEAGAFEVSFDDRGRTPASRHLRRTDVAILALERLDTLPTAAEEVPLILALAADGGAVVQRRGQAPLAIGELSRATLIGVLHDVPERRALSRRGHFCFLFGRGRASSPANSAANASSPNAVASELARLAQLVLQSHAATAPKDGPGRHLIDLARSLAGSLPDHRIPAPSLVDAAARFGLTTAERDLLSLTCLVEADPNAARLVALLNDHMQHTRPTIGLASHLGGDPRLVSAQMAADGPLRRFALVDTEGEGPLVTRPLRAPPAVWTRVLGLEPRPEFAEVSVAEADLDSSGLDADQAEAIRAALSRPVSDTDLPPIFAITGDRGVGREEIARYAARGSGILAVSAPATVLDEPGGAARLAREAAFAGGAAILTSGLHDPAPDWSAIGIGFKTPLIVVTDARGLSALAMGQPRPVAEVPAPRRTLAQRRRLWRAKAPADISNDVLKALAERFDFGLPEIGRALLMARRTGEVSADTLRATCETLRDTRFDSAAERLPCPFEPGDIVLAPDTRAELNLATRLGTARGGDLRRNRPRRGAARGRRAHVPV